MFSLSKSINKLIYALLFSIVFVLPFTFTAKANGGLKVSYAMYFTDAGWSSWSQDNSYLFK